MLNKPIVTNNLQEKSGKKSFFFDQLFRMLFYLLIFILPVLVLPFTQGSLEFDKQTVLVFFAFALLLAWVGKVLSRGKITIKKSLFNAGVIAFFTVIIASTLLSQSFYSSFMGDPGRYSGSLVTVLSLVLIYFLVFNSINLKQEVLNVLFIFIGSGFLVSVFGLLQFFNIFILPWDFAKSASFNTIGSVNSFGAFTAFSFLIILGFIPVFKNKLVRIILGTILALDFFILALIDFRFIWISLLAAIIFLIAFDFLKKKAPNFKSLSLPIIILIFVTLLILVKSPSARLLNLPLEIGPSFNSSYKIGFSALSSGFKTEVLGSGPETFPYNYARYKSQDINQTNFWGVQFNDSASEFLNLVPATGILGSAAFLLFIAIFIWLGFKNSFIKDADPTRSLNKNANLAQISEGETNFVKTPEISIYESIASTLFSAWLFLLIFKFFYPINITLEFLFWLTPAMFLVTATAKTKKRIFEFQGANLKALAVFSGLILTLIISLGSVYLLGERYAADVFFKQGLVLNVQEKSIDEVSNKLIKAATLNPYENRYWRMISQAFLIKLQEIISKVNQEGRQADQNELKNIQALSSNAINSAKRARDLDKANVSNWLNLGSTYQNLIGYVGGAEDWAITSYKEAAAREPVNPFIKTQIARVYISKSDILALKGDENGRNETLAQARLVLEEAIELKPNYAPAHFQIALVYAVQGEEEKAIQKQEELKLFSPNDVGVAFQLGLLYYNKNELQKAALEFEWAIALNPDYSNARYFLGLIYDKQGKKPEAIRQFEKIAELNPKNQEVKKILSNLRQGRKALSGISEPETAPIPEQEGAIAPSEKLMP